MNWKAYIVPLACSGLIHAGMLMALPWSRSVQVQHMRGDSAVELTVMPSDPARRRLEVRPAPVPDVPDIPPLPDRSRAETPDRWVVRDADFTEIPVHDRPEPPEQDPVEEPRDAAEPERTEERADSEPEQPADPTVERREVEREPEPEPEAPELAQDDHDAPDAPGDVLDEGVRSEAARHSVPRPDYPVLARRRGQEGAVAVRIRVSARGDAAGVELVESSGFSVLDDAALDAARRARFVPARRAGVPVASEVTIRYAFRLDEGR